MIGYQDSSPGNGHQSNRPHLDKLAWAASLLQEAVNKKLNIFTDSIFLKENFCILIQVFIESYF